MNTRFFCTYFDHRYLSRGLALHSSLMKQCPSFHLWILTLDTPSQGILRQMNLPFVTLISLQELEETDLNLIKAKQNRTIIEYYFTCTPYLPIYIIQNSVELDVITYLDADLFFFANPDPLFREMEGSSIGVIPHRYAPGLEHLEVHGKFNVGWVSFRRDSQGIACLEWWKERCIEWCFDRVEDGRYADQKYLDRWPDFFKGVAIIRHKGANLAPWNLGNYALSWKHNRVWVDEEPLIFYHFHSLHAIRAGLYNPDLEAYKAKSSPVLFRKVYQPYLQALHECSADVDPLEDFPATQKSIRERSNPPTGVPPSRIQNLTRKADWALEILKGLIARRFFLFLFGRVL